MRKQYVKRSSQSSSNDCVCFLCALGYRKSAGSTILWTSNGHTAHAIKLAVRRPTWRRSLRGKRVLSAEFTGNPRPMRDKSLSAHAIL